MCETSEKWLFRRHFEYVDDYWLLFYACFTMQVCSVNSILYQNLFKNKKEEEMHTLCDDYFL